MQFQGIPSGVALGTNSQKAAEVILEAWSYTRSAGIAVILESWCYTRKTGKEVVHAAATRFQGIPSGVALGTNSPDDGGNSIYTSSSKGRWYQWGSVIYTRVAWVTAGTGSQLFKRLYGVIDLNCLYHVIVL